VASLLQCSYEGTNQQTCEDLGCCFDPKCTSPPNPDGRPNDVLTKVEQREQVPVISFVTGTTGMCCYPKLREMITLEVLDAPQGMAWDPREGSLYVAQMKRHRVVKLYANESSCLLGGPHC